MSRMFLLFACLLVAFATATDYVTITSGTCSERALLNIMSVTECREAAIETGMTSNNAINPYEQSENDRPHGCRRQTFGSPLWINNKPNSPTMASTTHTVVCKVSPAYQNMGSGVCSNSNGRVAYAQIHNLGEAGCRQRCDADLACVGYNGATHGSWCFNFFNQPLTAHTDWSSQYNQHNQGIITGQDGSEGGTCYKKKQANQAGSAEMFYSFQLKGDIGGEAVTISDGDKVVLTTEWADFSVASQSITVSFLNNGYQNGQDMNVRFRSSMSTDIRLEEPHLAWNCGSENEDRRCELVREGVFAWEKTYRIDFSAVDYFISAPGQNCDDKCMSIGGECREDMLFPQSEHMVREWAAQAGVECKSFQQRCDMGESPTFFEENGMCTYCNDNTHPGWTDTRRKQSPLCQRRWGERERICPCSSSVLPQEFTRVANVCVSATDTDGTQFSVGYIGTVDAVRLVHRSGSVSCNTAGGHRYSNWGCDPNNNGMTILITADDTSRIFPTSGTSGYSDISGKQTWYNLAGHTSSSNTLTFEGPQQTILGTYRAVYGDALPVWNSHADNGGATCFDVYMKGPATPTTSPTAIPTTSAPTIGPSLAPTDAPSLAPTAAPSLAPTDAPSLVPTDAPSPAPTAAPSPAPTAANPMFSVTSDDNSCLHEVHDIGMVIGTGAHTIHTKLTLPEYTGPRQWILNLGQESQGANHWIWGGSAIQFGTWSGYQIQDVDITSCADLTTTFDGDHTLKLYCDGELVGQEENANINIRDSILAIGGIQGLETPDGDFKGCVEEVKLWTSELSASQVQSLTTAFVQGPKTGCPPGYAQPKSAEHCKLVAQASNVRYWGGAGHSSSADPRGCIYRTPDKDIYFNTHIRGSTSRNDRRTVCVKVDSEITSDRKL